VSLLFHSVAGVTYWEWNLHHPAAAGNLAGVQPTELAIVLATEESAAPGAKIEDIVKTESAPLPLAATSQPDLPPRPMPVEQQVPAEAPVVPAQVTANDSALIVPAPANPRPGVPAIVTSENANADARASAAAQRSGNSVGENNGSLINFAGYRRNPLPAYPPLAQSHRWEGTVLLSVRISPDGTAAEVKVKESSGYAVLDEAAVAAVRNWEFEPARVNQQSISSTAEVPIHFQLRTAKAR
jgi:protein TonB